MSINLSYKRNENSISINNQDKAEPSIQIKEKIKILKNFKIQNNNSALVILCFCAFCQNAIINGANNAVLTTIERAYYMSSLDTALFLSVYDVSNIIASPIIGYFGDRKYKPKIISLSMLGLSLGSFIMVIPHLVFIKNTAQHPDVFTEEDTEIQKGQALCLFANHSSLISSPKSSSISFLLKKMKYIFYASNIINGISSVALYTIGISYIESIFIKEKVYLRQGIYYASAAIGVGIGMLATGNFLNIHGILIKGKSEKKSSPSAVQNYNWVGAWWIIYIISIAANLILSLLVLTFSPKLIVTNDQESNSFGTNFKDFIKNGSKIISNRVFLFITICSTFETFLIKGFSSNLTKFLEYEYRLPASTATMIAGGIGFLSLVFGPLLGAYLVKKYKWTLKHCSRFVLFILTITSFIFLGLIFNCPQETYINSSSKIFKKTLCVCDSNIFYPICYKNFYMFQSPCHAGCLKITKPNLFSKCAIIENLTNQTITMSPCTRPSVNCISNLAIVSTIGLIVLFLSSIIILPILRIILESISSENQSFALAIRSLVNKLFGNIPGPIVFAIFIDRSCIQWTKSPITGSKVCRLFNNHLFSLSLALLGSTLRIFSAISACITLLLVRKQNTFVINDPTRNSESKNQNVKDRDKM